jgi:hypothetical protein
MVPMIPAMTSMPAMEDVQKRAQQQQSVGQKLHDVRPMLRPEKISRNG